MEVDPHSPEGKARANELSSKIIGAAIDVHRELGPGLLESAYEACLCYELACRNMPFQRQVPVPVIYKLHFLTKPNITLPSAASR